MPAQMRTTGRMTMADAETYLVRQHGWTRQAARERLRAMHDRAWHHGHSSWDEKTFSIDYTKTGGRYGRGRFQFLEDDPA